MAHIDTSDIIRGSVWIRPGGEALSKIEDAINAAHRRGGGLAVQPHVTLLSGLETTQANAELKLKRLATRMQPFTIRLGQIDISDSYFKALFAEIAASDELVAAQHEAYEIFEMKPAPPFEPHLSLLYGDLDQALKQELVSVAGGTLDISFEVGSLYLVNASPSLPVTSWRTLAEHPVGR